MSGARKLLYVVHLPPPVHGVAEVNRRVVDDTVLNAPLQTRVLEIRSSKDLAELDAMTLRKLGATLRMYVRLMAECWSYRPHCAYLSPVPTGPGFLRDLILICILRGFGVKRILHLHGLGIGRTRKRVMRALYRFALRDAAVISISAIMQEQELGWLQLPASRFYVVPNASPDVTVARRRTPRDESVVRLLFLSATFRTKGVFVLLDAFRSLARRCDRVELEVVGSSRPDVDQAIASWIDAHGLRNRVCQRGSLHDDAKLCAYARADVFVHPTLRDYFPLVLLEAMSMGLPVVSTRVGGIPEIVDEECGFLCEPNDPEGLGAALERLVLDRDLRRRCGTAARRRFERDFSPANFHRRMYEVFRAEGLYP